LLESENKFLRDQVATKDDQIRQANILTQGLQRLIAGLTRTPDPVANPDNVDRATTITQNPEASQTSPMP
jgi:hypothetical protein